MKRILLLGLFLGIGVQLFAQGIDFKPVPFSEALRMAKTQHKMLFVDCYTSWCGPCRYMADSIFTRKETGDYFNKRFISVKYDIEKDEAKEFNALYTVGSFPTFWIFSPQGEVIYRMGGASLTVKEWLRRRTLPWKRGQNWKSSGRITGKTRMKKILRPIWKQWEISSLEKESVNYFWNSLEKLPIRLIFCTSTKIS